MADDNKIDLEINLKDEKARLALQRITTAAKELEQREARAQIKTEQLAKSLNNKLANAATIAGEKTKQAALKTQLLEERLKKATTQTGIFSTTIGKISLASFIGNITSRAVSSGITTIVNGLSRIVEAGREFEDGLVAVGKTTGISGRALDALGNRITELSRTIPVSTKSLLEIATVAGQLGLKSSADIVQFTETLGKLQLATDITGEEGSQSVAKILTITGELEKNGSDNIDKFGNVITRLGNDFAATESQILKVATRVSQGIAPFGVASEDILAISTALKATGSEAEASGTAIQKTFALIGEATKEGGPNLTKFANAAGLTNDEFIKLFENDPAKLFVTLAKNLGEANLKGADLNAVLKDLGLSDARLARSLNPLITRYGTLEKALSSARGESQDRIALDEEARKAADTLSGDVQALSNAYDELAKELFQDVGPALRAVVQGITAFTDGVKSLVNGNVIDGMIGSLAAVATALVLINIKAILLASTGIPALVAGLGALAVEITVATGGLNLLIPLIAAAGFAIGKYLGDVRDAADEQKEFNRQVIESADAFENLDKPTQDYLNSLNQYTGGLERANGVMEKLSTVILPGVNKNLVEVAEGSEEAAKALEKLGLFDDKKLAGLKKFFSEEEQLRLKRKFNTLKDEAEIDAFRSNIASIARRRQSEDHKRTLGLDKETLDSIKALAEEKKRIDEEQRQVEEERRFQKQAELLQETEEFQIFNQGKLDALKIYFSEEEIIRAEARISQIENERIKQIEIEKLENEAFDRRLKAKIDNARKLQNVDIVANKIIAEDNKELAEERERINKLTVVKTGQFFGAMSSLARAGGKEFFELQKAFALAQIAVNGIQQVSEAAKLPWPANIPAVAFAVADAAARTASVVATNPSFEMGGIVPGTSFTGDRVQANVNSGEMILNRQQQRQLFSIANGGGNGNEPKQFNITVQSVLDGEIVAESVSKQVANGFILGEVQ